MDRELDRLESQWGFDLNRPKITRSILGNPHCGKKFGIKILARKAKPTAAIVPNDRTGIFRS